MCISHFALMITSYLSFRTMQNNIEIHFIIEVRRKMNLLMKDGSFFLASNEELS